MSDSSHYIDQKTVNASYRPKAGVMSAGLKRARAPYRVKNALTGIGLGAFAVGVWAYSISAVRQDVFDDVDEEARAMARTGIVNEASKAEEIAQPIGVSQSQPIKTSPTVATNTSISSAPSPQCRGLLRHLDSRFPRLLDPETKTYVWGAPPVDNIGKVGGSRN
ncbi:hypothetical protein C0993_010817 [Termitomyces sp. T159_Od127]|nr:hypothetical protein C0993_010817 [Termitomyces sp. T159_Od127]